RRSGGRPGAAGPLRRAAAEPAPPDAALSAEPHAHRRNPGGGPGHRPQYRGHDDARSRSRRHLPAADAPRHGRNAPRGMKRLAFRFLLVLGACAPRWQPPSTESAAPQLLADRMVMTDGAALPLRQWQPKGEPKAVILALHGFNDYSFSFDAPAKDWAAAGIAT